MVSRKGSMTTIRQGDLLFKRVSDQPKQVETKQLVIAEGEVTGHNHVLIADMDSVILGDKTIFSVSGKAKLVHPEHDTIEFGAGTYMVINEREFDYVAKQAEKVID